MLWLIILRAVARRRAREAWRRASRYRDLIQAPLPLPSLLSSGLEVLGSEQRRRKTDGKKMKSLDKGHTPKNGDVCPLF